MNKAGGAGSAPDEKSGHHVLGRLLRRLDRLADRARSALAGDDVPEPGEDTLKVLNHDWTVSRELGRQDSISTTLLQLSVVGTTAAAAVAAAAHTGRFRPVLVAAALSLSVPAIFALLALSLSPLARRAEDIGPWNALQSKLRLNRLAFYSLFFVVYLATLAGLAVGLT